jgi:hypothetical protein
LIRRLGDGGPHQLVETHGFETLSHDADVDAQL